MGKDLQTDFPSARKPRNLEVNFKHRGRGSLNPLQAERNEGEGGKVGRREVEERRSQREQQNQEGNLDGSLDGAVC
ncbi:hypothetical protein PITC_011250 [Penicillium italicum]|uniref:Uncharacterized protein n=1 Tax=Penicillium italicum TaxID=40296 RepID=A0A0A2L5I3_PENIT|nr:hypothetical protein PITC_011250 [Penicillium italicum]